MSQIKTITVLLVLFCLSTSALQAQINWWNNNEKQKAFLGVESSRISKEKAALLAYDNVYGQMIDRVVPKSAAEAAGLQPFDYLVGIDQEEMGWTTELTDLLANYKSGDRATVHFYRKDKKQSVKVEFLPREQQIFNGNIFRKNIFSDDEPFLGVSASNDSNNEELGVSVNIIQGSTADEMGLRDGDIIEFINGFAMIDWSDISRAISMLEVGSTITIEYRRAGKTYTESSTIQTRPSRGYSIRNFWNDESEGERPFLGIYSESISEEKAEKLDIDNPYGSSVTSVFRNSAAAQAGLQPFDYIYGIDEYRVGENQDLTDIIRKYKVGESATLHFMRKGKSYSKNITFGSRDEAREPQERSRCEDPFLGVQQSSGAATDKGVRVSIVGKSTAASLGLRDGDIIASINDYPILEWGDIRPAVDMLSVGDPIVIGYFRGGQKRTISGEIGSYCDTYGSGSIWNNNWFSRNEDTEVDLSEVDLAVDRLSNSAIRQLNDDFSLQLGTANNLTVNNFQLSPDDQGAILLLQFELPEKGETLVQIYNESGRQVYTYDLGYFSGEFSDELDLVQNGKGTYYLNIKQGARSLIQSISIR